MPEGNEQQTQQSQAGASQQPQAGTPNTTTATETPQAGGTQSTTAQATQQGGLTHEQALEELAKVRREAAQHRTELKKFQDAQAAAELAKLGDLERANKQLETVSKQVDAYRARIADMAVQLAAGKLGIRDPEVAATLIRAQLDIDAETGEPKNADELLKELLRAKPYLKAEPEPAQRQPSAGATNPGRGTAANPGTGNQPPAKTLNEFARFGRGQSIFQTGRNNRQQ